ncbi:MAG: HlyD family type I secretion periplasmic adaptor subunit, partial [Flavobacteriales bacterium]|nr:HlyD family type I secretion periplasmic adaptor subunit [Flavobacteriales bacterium]
MIKVCLLSREHKKSSKFWFNLKLRSLNYFSDFSLISFVFMTNSTSNGIAPGSSSKVSTSADSLLSQLPGLSASDSNTLLGRNRLAQALELEDPQDNLFVRRSLYVLGAAALIFFPWAALTPITQVIEASGEVIP